MPIYKTKSEVELIEKAIMISKIANSQITDEIKGEVEKSSQNIQIFERVEEKKNKYIR